MTPSRDRWRLWALGSPSWAGIAGNTGSRAHGAHHGRTPMLPAQPPDFTTSQEALQARTLMHVPVSGVVSLGREPSAPCFGAPTWRAQGEDISGCEVQAVGVAAFRRARPGASSLAKWVRGTAWGGHGRPTGRCDRPSRGVQKEGQRKPLQRLYFMWLERVGLLQAGEGALEAFMEGRACPRAAGCSALGVSRAGRRARAQTAGAGLLGTWRRTRARPHATLRMGPAQRRNSSRPSPPPITTAALRSWPLLSRPAGLPARLLFLEGQQTRGQHTKRGNGTQANSKCFLSVSMAEPTFGH